MKSGVFIFLVLIQIGALFGLEVGMYRKKLIFNKGSLYERVLHRKLFEWNQTAHGDSETTCSDGWMAYEGFCYLFGHDTYTFPEAEHYCRQHKSHLMEITDAQENAFVKDHLREYQKRNWWVAITDELVEGIWRYYTSDSVVSYTDWHPGQPDLSKYGEDCVVMWADFDFQWGDLHCNVACYPICKKAGNEEAQGIIG